MRRKVRVKGKGHEIFFEGPEEIEGEVSAVTSKLRRKPKEKSTITPAEQQTVKTAEEPVQVELTAGELPPPIKATFYLRPDQVEELENLFTTVRSKHGIRVGKSEIVRVALDMLFSEYKSKLEASSILPKLRQEEEEEKRRRQKKRVG